MCSPQKDACARELWNCATMERYKSSRAAIAGLGIDAAQSTDCHIRLSPVVSQNGQSGSGVYRLRSKSDPIRITNGTLCSLTGARQASDALLRRRRSSLVRCSDKESEDKSETRSLRS